MSSQPFGTTPPPAQDPGGPAQDATAGANAAAARRSPLVRLGVPIAAGLLLAGGLTAVLTGGPAADDAGFEAASPPPTTATPEPEPSLAAPETFPVSAQRNPFDPLVRDTSTGTGTGTGTGGTGTASGLGGSSGDGGSYSSGYDGSSGGPTPSLGGTSGGGSSSAGSSSGSSGSSSGSGSGSGNSGSGSGNQGSSNQGSSNQGPSNQGSGTTLAPPATPAKPDAVATCKAGDDLWKSYREAMKDASTTHTMAGHRIGPVTTGVGDLARTTSVAQLRQPLQSWERATASVRTQLVNGQGVRDLVLADPLENSTGGAPFVGTRPIVDESSILLARTAVRERCYQLTDPLVNQGDL